MKCPKCQEEGTRVVDSRGVREGAAVRRRRLCPKCHARFTTYEEMDRSDVMVVKRDGRREIFSAGKVKAGVRRACSKLPVSDAQVEGIAGTIASRLAARPEREVTSIEIGQMAAERLRQLDEVAYLRFVSVFRRYRDAGQFLAEIENLIRR